MTILMCTDYTAASRCGRAIQQHRADCFIEEARKAARANGWEIKVWWNGIEFYNPETYEQEDWWDYDD